MENEYLIKTLNDIKKEVKKLKEEIKILNNTTKKKSSKKKKKLSRTNSHKIITKCKSCERNYGGKKRVEKDGVDIVYKRCGKHDD